jgi:hypothetical protein
LIFTPAVCSFNQFALLPPAQWFVRPRAMLTILQLMSGGAHRSDDGREEN